MTDDVGFGASSVFGGPVATPTFGRLARNGLRYNAFNTAALCSPTRAALLTGRNPHNVGMGYVPNLPTGYPGYTSVIPDSAATIADVLGSSGYSTAMFGKGHVTPEWEMSQAGPFDRWPTGLGFDYFYGFLSADVSQFDPFITENTLMVPRPAGEDYHFDKDLADHAIDWIGRQHAAAPDKPFFAYYATGTAHSPHHAPKQWLDKYRGRFDGGWDVMRQEIFQRQKALGIIPANAKLTPRPALFPAWSTLSPDQKRLYARLMEAYAASLTHADYQMGRILDFLDTLGELDNTLIIYIQGDNGGSAEGGENGFLFEQSFINGFREPLPYMLANIGKIGGPESYSNVPTPWSWAMDSPFQWVKGVASHFGGTRNGMVISWPYGIKEKGGIRSQFHFVSDIAPTLYEVAGITSPDEFHGVRQLPIDGISMAYSFNHRNAPTHRTTQVFEIMQNLGIYHDGWWAGTTPVRLPGNKFGSFDIDRREWELYNVTNDFSQEHDLSKSMPGKLAELRNMFWRQARSNNILPLHEADAGTDGMPQLNGDRASFTYLPGSTRIVEAAAPHTMGRSFSIDAKMNIANADAEGVLVTQGGRFGGYAFYLKNGVPIFHYNAVGPRQYYIAATRKLTAGSHVLRAQFDIDEARRGAGGWLSLSLDGEEIGRGRIDHTLSGWVGHTEGFDVGCDTVTPIDDDYTIENSRFNAELVSLTVQLDAPE